MKLEVVIFKKLAEFDLDVCFESHEDRLGLMGPSGSGKSMVLKCIAGIITPDAGRIVLDDEVLFDSNLKINISPQKRKIGYMFQNYALFDHMNVYQNIAAPEYAGNSTDFYRWVKNELYIALYSYQKLEFWSLFLLPVHFLQTYKYRSRRGTIFSQPNILNVSVLAAFLPMNTD